MVDGTLHNISLSKELVIEVKDYGMVAIIITIEQKIFMNLENMKIQI